MDKAGHTAIDSGLSSIEDTVLLGSNKDTQAKVFVCYAQEDQTHAGGLVHRLKQRGFDAWSYQEKMGLGDPIPTVITREIGRSDYFVVFVSAHALRSEWVRYEIDTALALRNHDGHRPDIIPVLLDETPTFATLMAFNAAFGGQGPDALADEIARRMRSSPSRADRQPNLRPPEPDPGVASIVEKMEAVFPQASFGHVFWIQLGLGGDAPFGPEDTRTQVWTAFVRAAVTRRRVVPMLRFFQKSAGPTKEEVFKELRKQRAHRWLSLSRTAHDYLAKRASLDDLQERVRGLADAQHAEETHDSAPAEYRIAVIGAFSSGKSTFINALVGARILPETNLVATPCPTFVRRTRGPERCFVRFLTSRALASGIRSILPRLCMDNEALERAILDENWLAAAVELDGAIEPKPFRDSDRTAWLEFVEPAIRAAAEHSSLLGAERVLSLDAVRDLRVESVTDADRYPDIPRPLLAHIEAETSSELVPEHTCFLDTPGVTSQNPLHRDFAWEIVQSAHALVAVEPHDSPLTKGPDELMQSFYARLVEAARSESDSSSAEASSYAVRSVNKVFVIINKSDLADTDLARANTVATVSKRYGEAWGVPRVRCYSTSARVVLAELDGTDAGAHGPGVGDWLIEEFRRLRFDLERHLVDQLGKRWQRSRALQLQHRLEAIRLRALERLESMEASAEHRQGLIEGYGRASANLDAALETARQALRGVELQGDATLRETLLSALSVVRDRAQRELDFFNEGFKSLPAGIVVRFFASILHELLPRVCVACLARWSEEELAVHARMHVLAVEWDLLKALDETTRELKSDLWALSSSEYYVPSTGDAKEAHHFAAQLPSPKQLRGLWEALEPDRVDTFFALFHMNHHRQRLEQLVDQFLDDVADTVMADLAGVAAPYIDRLSQASLERVGLLADGIRVSLDAAKLDANRSAEELTLQRVEVEAEIDRVEKLLDEVGALSGAIAEY